MRAACSSQAGGGAAPLGFPKPSVYNSFAWSSDAVTPLACFTQMDFSFLDFSVPLTLVLLTHSWLELH